MATQHRRGRRLGLLLSMVLVGFATAGCGSSGEGAVAAASKASNAASAVQKAAEAGEAAHKTITRLMGPSDKPPPAGDAPAAGARRQQGRPQHRHGSPSSRGDAGSTTGAPGVPQGRRSRPTASRSPLTPAPTSTPTSPAGRRPCWCASTNSRTRCRSPLRVFLPSSVTTPPCSGTACRLVRN